MAEAPDGIVSLGSFTPTGEQLATIRAGLEKALARGHRVRCLTPLPRRTRLRLWRDHQANTIGAWLCAHHACGLAILLWRALGMWS